MTTAAAANVEPAFQGLPRLIHVSGEEVGRVNRPIEDEPYYHGYMTRSESDGLLKNGCFLVRKAEVGGVSFYVISLMHDGQSHNFLVKRTTKKRLFWVHRFAFKTVADLVQYHHRNREPINEDGLVLLTPCYKHEWQLNHEQVELHSKLGEGAFGEVMKGTLQMSLFLPRITVAVKTLHADSLSGDERIKFLKEANLMLQLNHVNVIKFFGVCAAKEPIMIVMELATDSLSNRLQDKVYPPTMTDKVNFVYGAARGMAYLESKSIIHRDIAARNCLIGEKREIKISDFGLSILGSDYREKKMKTVPLRWMAPETLKKGRYSQKSDVFSFGVLIWEIYSEGRMPYGEKENEGLRKMILEKKIALVEPTEIQPEVAEIRLKCSDFDPNGRPTFGEIEAEVAKIPTVIPAKNTSNKTSSCFSWLSRG